MVGFSLNNKGRYKCDYCDHKSYKTWGGANNHVLAEHQAEHDLVLAKNEIARLKARPPEVKERVVYKDKPQPEYWYIENNGGVYCETCRIVQMRVGIPAGQTIENTPHSPCGNRTLKLVLEVK